MPATESAVTTQFSRQQQPPRCQHTLISGENCGQPALRNRDLCRFHQAVAPTRREFILPIVEDAASLQLALNRVMRALADDLLTYKKASLLLYALQIAASNFKRLRDDRQELRKRKSPEEEDSLVKLLLQQLAIPETPEELAAEFSAEQHARESAQYPIDNRQSTVGNASAVGAEAHSRKIDVNACAEPPAICHSASAKYSRFGLDIQACADDSPPPRRRNFPAPLRVPPGIFRRRVRA